MIPPLARRLRRSRSKIGGGWVLPRCLREGRRGAARLADARQGTIDATIIAAPPYSPDFNPIQMLLAKLKTLLRKAAERTIASLWATIGRLLDDFSADECSRYLAYAGYGSI